MYPANAYGLHDMHGNLFEWCEDILHNDFTGAPDDATPWTNGAGVWPDYYVLRGASWVNPPSFCRSAFRFGNIPIYKSIAIGFRVVVRRVSAHPAPTARERGGVAREGAQTA